MQQQIVFLRILILLQYRLTLVKKLGKKSIFIPSIITEPFYYIEGFVRVMGVLTPREGMGSRGRRSKPLYAVCEVTTGALLVYERAYGLNWTDLVSLLYPFHLTLTPYCSVLNAI